jgi:imidazoleglycerol-phosphate dehydratase
MSKTTPGVRYAEIDRETSETSVRVVLDLDGGTRRDIATGIGFFDHMLAQTAFHGQFDLGVSVEGDVEMDDHHTVEDVGIVLGRALKEAIGPEAIERYSDCTTPMDEALVQVVLDVSGRGQAFLDLPFRREKIGGLSTECVSEFFRALAMNAGMTIHVRKIAGDNDHHTCEAAFKSLGRALHAATQRSDRRGSTSTKGKID